MDISEVKSSFELVRANRRAIAKLRAEAEALKLSCMGGAIRYDKDRVQTSPENYQEEWLVQAADLDRKADRLIQSGDRVRDQLYKWMAVCEQAERIVLINHYINDMTYREIEYECADALDNKTYARAYQIAQDGIIKISENF